MAESKFEALFEAANRDPTLKKKLLQNPQAVAEEFGVKFTGPEVDQLKKLGAIVELAEDIKFGRLYPGIPPHVGYPVTVWKARELAGIIRQIIPPPLSGYPAQRIMRQAAGRMAMKNFQVPGPIFYPPDDWPWGGGGWRGGGGVIFYRPGPIFYPAGWLSQLEATLTQILQAKGQTKEE